jgi:hypothetical protein
VFISEYKAPKDFICISQKTKHNTISGKGATRKRIEKVFLHSSQINDSLIQKILKNKSYGCKTKHTTRKASKASA